MTTDELTWFTAELNESERRTLRDDRNTQSLLADAYRKRLAARVTAARVAAHAKREAVAVERRIQTDAIRAAERLTLDEDLMSDRRRLGRIEAEAIERERGLKRAC